MPSIRVLTPLVKTAVSLQVNMVSDISTNIHAVLVCHHRTSSRPFLEKLGLLDAGPGTLQAVNCAVQPGLHQTGDRRWTSRTGKS